MNVEADFVAWLDRQDAEALGRVFDAHGGKLLLLAAHLAGDGAAAGDLVQATFLAAMARGASWDRSRPLWPWLAAVLHNELRMQRRRRRRRREVDLDDAAAAASASPGPAQLAASEEAVASVVQAIDALPLPYRQVLRRRLVHGLRPIDIARSLEVPVGTVRAQLHRGLEQLRVALPAGVGGLLAALLMTSDSVLAQVRAHVLEGVARATPVGTAPGLLLGGWMSMNGKTVGLVIAAGVLLAFVSFAIGLPARSGASPRSTEPAQVVEANSPASREAAPPTSSLPREPAGAPTASRWPFEVAVLEEGKGLPIAKAQVEVWTAPSCLQITNRVHGSFGRQDVATGETGPDGLFRASLGGLAERTELFRATNLLWVRARWPHGEPRDHLVDLRLQDGEKTTVTIELARRRVLTGIVVDGRGGPVAAARVMALRPSTDLRFAELYDHRLSDRDGSFVLAVDDEPEGWPTQVAIVDDQEGLATVVVPPRPAAPVAVDLGTVVLVAGHAVRGQVVLGDGMPLAQCQVELDAVDPAVVAGAEVRGSEGKGRLGQRQQGIARSGNDLVRLSARTTTRADGSFVFPGLDPKATYVVHVDAFTLHPVASATVRPGAESVQLRVEAQWLTIEARDLRGELLPGAALLAEGFDPATRSPAPRLRPGFPEAGYRCGNVPFVADEEGRLGLLSPFGWIWRVATSGDSAEPIVLRHDVLPGIYRATRELVLRAEQRFGKLHVVVVDEHGAPLPNWGVKLQAVERDVQHNHSRMVAPAEGAVWTLSAGAWDLHVLLGREELFAEADSYVRGYHAERIVIDDGRTTEVKVLAKPAGQVLFRIEPSAARAPEVRIQEGGRDVALTCLYRDPRMAEPSHGDGKPVLWLTRQALPPGPHSFVVQRDGFRPAVVTVDVAADQLVEVRVDLQPQ